MIFLIVFWVSAVALFALCVVFAGSGLFYLAEVAEEHTILAKKCLIYGIYTVIGCHVLLLFEIPLFTVCVGLATHCFYLHWVKTEFPFFEMVSFKAVVASVGFLVSSVTWFLYFKRDPQRLLHIIPFLFLINWMTPLALLTTSTVNESVLPTDHTGESSQLNLGIGEMGKKESLMKKIVRYGEKVVGKQIGSKRT